MALISKKNNRQCIVCNCSYYYCGHCDEPIRPSWYNIFHDQNCHDIYDAVANILPLKGKKAAKEALDKLDLSNKSNFHPNIIKSINEIYDIKDESKTEEIKSGENIKEEKEEVVVNTTTSVTNVKVEKTEPVKVEITKSTSTKAKVVNKNKK